MGTASSKGGTNLTKEQQDVSKLGEKFPFGDDELHKLHFAYHEIRAAEERISFLTDWAVHCAANEQRDERLVLIQVVESKILPPGLGNRLEQVAFLAKGDVAHDYESTATPVAVPPPEDEYSRMARLEQFFQGASNVGRRGGRHALGVVFDCCSLNKEEANVAPPKQLLDLGYRLGLAAAFLEAAKNNDDDMQQFIPPESIQNNAAFQAMAQSILTCIERQKIRDSDYGTMDPKDQEVLKEGLVEKMDFIEWSEAHAPLLASTISTFMHLIFFPDKPYPPSRTAFCFPKLPRESSFFSTPTCSMLFYFALSSQSLGGTWHRLYTSSSDGLSFNRLQNSLLGYGGPTLLIVQAAGSGGIFGAFTASQWKESKDFYGNSDCFLYTLLPTTAAYRPSGNAHNYMYCNSHARSKGFDQQAHGIGFGGDVHQPRLFIDESFDNCIAGAQDLTFTSGTLLPKTADGSFQRNFDIDLLEVWGVGGEQVVMQALGAQDAQREITAANIKKARKVDKAAFLDDFRSGLIDSKAFKHRGQIQGRADCDVEDMHNTHKYEYEK